jgi:hypothetical protein
VQYVLDELGMDAGRELELANNAAASLRPGNVCMHASEGRRIRVLLVL